MRIHVMDLIEGDSLEKDIFNSYGLHVLSAGTLLDANDITKLFQHAIDYVEITPRQKAHAPEQSRNAKSDHIVETEKAYSFAVDNIKEMFADALAKGKINEEQVTESFNPLVQQFKEEKDVVSLLLYLNGKDDYTFHHSVQVGLLSYYIAKWMGVSEEGALLAGKAGYLHDLGKCKIDPAILNKPSRLTDSEYEEIKKHTIYGQKIIKQSFDNPILSYVALEHHERLNGTGYPYGIKSEAIKPLSKIIAVADIYSAMISTRVYQKERDLLSVLQELHQASFAEIDPKISQVFIRHMIPNFVGKNALLSNGDMGIIVFTNPHDLFRPLLKVNGKFINLSHQRELQIAKILM